MRRDRRLLTTVLLAALGAAVLLVAWLGAMALLLGSVMEPELRLQVRDSLLPHLPLVVMGVLLLMSLLGMGVIRLMTVIERRLLHWQ